MGADVGQDHLGAQREGVGAVEGRPVGPRAFGGLDETDAQFGEDAQLGPHPGAGDMGLVRAGRGEGEHPGRIGGGGGDDGAQPLPGGVEVLVRVRPPRGAERAGEFGEPVADLAERTGLADVEDDHRDPLLQGLGRLGSQPVDMTAAVADGHHEVRLGAQQPLDVQGAARAQVLDVGERQSPGLRRVGVGSVVVGAEDPHRPDSEVPQGRPGLDVGQHPAGRPGRRRLLTPVVGEPPFALFRHVTHAPLPPTAVPFVRVRTRVPAHLLTATPL
ncbi:hypothetical protein [Streptomyces parvus]|uniref:hypothetical protein n=1 Tax=Streptomyces parvus TaxID=66428 RepID=UPI003556EACF